MLMKDPTTGKIKKGYIGYSWTMLFFHPLPPFFRRDFTTCNTLCFLITAQTLLITQTSILADIPPLLVFACITCPGFVWSFFWNQRYTENLLAQGYVFAESEDRNTWAAIELGKKKTGTAKVLGCYAGVLLVLVFAYLGNFL